MKRTGMCLKKMKNLLFVFIATIAKNFGFGVILFFFSSLQLFIERYRTLLIVSFYNFSCTESIAIFFYAHISDENAKSLLYGLDPT